MSAELKTCPRGCQGSYASVKSFGKSFRVECSCGWSGPVRGDEARASSAWGTRHITRTDLSQAAVAAALEAAAELLDGEADDLEASASRFRGGTNPHHSRRDLATVLRVRASNIRALITPAQHDALAAENATLRAERDEARKIADHDTALWLASETVAATLRASEAAAMEREGDMRQALQAAMNDDPGWYDLAREARNASLSARTQRLIARQALPPTADKEPKT